MKRVLGLDASTVTIGLAILEYDELNINLIHHGFFKPPENENIFEKLAQVRDFIYSILDGYQPDHVALEDIILFMKGRSTASTISSLAVLNRTVGLAVYNQSGKSPKLLNVMKIRHAIKINKLPSKEEIPNLIAKRLNIEFPWIYKINKKTKKKEIIKENFDIGDAISCAYCYVLLERANSVNTKKIKKAPLTKKTKKKLS